MFNERIIVAQLKNDYAKAHTQDTGSADENNLGRLTVMVKIALPVRRLKY